MHNYYEELELDRSLSLKDLNEQLRQRRRRYRQLSGAVSQDQRLLAETMLARIAEAEKVFSSEESRAEYDRQLAIAPSPKPVTAMEMRDGTDLLEQARKYYQEGAYRVALKAASEYTRIEPRDSEGWLVRAESALMLRDYSEAEFAARTGRDIDPSVVLFYWIIGEVHLVNNETGQAVSVFKEAISMVPDNVWLRTRLAAAYDIAGSPDIAISTLMDAAQTIAPNDATLYEQAADIAYRAKNYAQQAQLLATASKIEPNEPSYVSNQMLALGLAGQLDQALCMADQVLQNSNLNQTIANSAFITYLDGLESSLACDDEGNTYIINAKQVESYAIFLGKMESIAAHVSPEYTKNLPALREQLKFASSRHLCSLGVLGRILLVVMFFFILPLFSGAPALVVLFCLFVVAGSGYLLFNRIYRPGYKIIKEAVGYMNLVSRGLE